MKRLLSLLSLILFIPGLLLAQEVTDATVQNQEAAQQFSLLLEDTQTLRANIEQLTLDQNGREIQVFQARMVLDKPDHFYWEILSPYSELLLTDGEKIWRSEPDLEQVTIEAFQNDLSRTPVLLLNGDAEAIAESYFIAAATMDFGNRQRFVLTPKIPNSLYTRLSLTFNDKVIEEMQFESSLGQKTSLTFSEVEINSEIAPVTFVFQMPEGVEVIDNSGG